MSDYIDFIDSNGNEWTRTTRFREAKETIAAQAAVIEAIKRGMCNLDPVIQWLINGCDVSEAVRELQIYNHLKNKAIAIPTDSKEIIAEVRRAEREKVIEKCVELGAIERDGVFAEEIRAIE